MVGAKGSGAVLEGLSMQGNGFVEPAAFLVGMSEVVA